MRACLQKHLGTRWLEGRAQAERRPGDIATAHLPVGVLWCMRVQAWASAFRKQTTRGLGACRLSRRGQGAGPGACRGLGQNAPEQLWEAHLPGG